MHIRHRVAVAASFLAVGCKADAPAQPLGPCTAAVDLTLEFDQGFEMRWTPACGVARLSIVSPPGVGSGIGYWLITSPTSSITPPVQYGKLPGGAVEVQPTPTFIPSGELFVVQLRAANGDVLAQESLRVP